MSFIIICAPCVDSCCMGNLSFFLGMEIHHTSKTIYLSQTRYDVDLIKKCNMESCKPSPTPMASTTHLSSLDGDPLPYATSYRSMVGGLQYLMLSQPDIAFAVNQVCQFIHNPHNTQLQAVKRIYRYIKWTLELVLNFTSLVIISYMVMLTLTGPGLLIIVDLQHALVFFLAPIYSPGPPRNNPLSPVLVLKLNTWLLPPPLLNFVGSTTYFMNSRSHFALLCVSLWTTFPLSTWQPIPSSMLELVTLRLIITSYVSYSHVVFSAPNIFPPTISWPTSLPRISLGNDFILLLPSSISTSCRFAWGGMKRTPLYS